MVQSCSAFACQNRFKEGSGKSFHQFPWGKPELLKKWLHAVRKTDWKPSIIPLYAAVISHKPTTVTSIF